MKKTICAIVIMLGLVAPRAADAAKFLLRFEPAAPYGVGQTFAGELFLEAGSSGINGIEGEISLPSHVNITEVRTAGSAIPLWVVPPALPAGGDEAKVISFAGIVPSGSLAGTVPVFSFVGSTVRPGISEFAMSGRAAVSDGSGTAEAIAERRTALPIIESQRVRPFSDPLSDNDAPEPFSPYVASDDSVFGGEPALFFSAVDKGTGVAFYEIGVIRRGEGGAPTWQKSASPAKLSDFSGARRIFVKATDQRGNYRIAELPAEDFRAVSPQSPAANAALWVILILIALFAAVFLRGKRRSSHRKDRDQEFP